MPVKLREVCPALTVLGVMPVQVPPTVWLAEICMFTRVSVKLPLVWEIAPGLFMVRVTVEVPPDMIWAGEKALPTAMVPTPRAAVGEGRPTSGVWVLVAPLVLLG